MISRFLTAALLAGFIAGLVVTGLQQATTAPLIHQAEQFEASGPAGHHHPTGSGGGHTHSHGSDTAAWAPHDGLERIAFTTLANVITGIGFAFLLVAGMAFRSVPVSGATGVLWGLAGFAVFTLAPSFGLPPELPTMNAAGLASRQAWWIGTAAATAAGLWLLILPGQTLRTGLGRPATAAIGILVIALPHIIGAPHTPETSAQIPPELAARFVAMSIGTSAVFWACLGWLAGSFYGRGMAEDTATGELSASS